MIRAALLAVVASTAVLSGQAPDAQFEIASIRPTRFDWPIDAADEAAWMAIARSGGRTSRLSERAMPPVALVQMAYDVWGHQLQNVPAWARSARYAVDLRTSSDVSFEQMRPMLRRMLAERFNLVVRRDVRTLPMFELVPATGGITFAPLKEGGCITRTADTPLPPMSLSPDGLPNICGWGRRIVVSQTPTRVEQIEGVGVPMANLIRRLEPEVGRIIIDRTGFTGNFSYRVAFAPSNAVSALAGAPPQDPTGLLPVQASAPAIGVALTEQLGLELRSTQGPVEVLIIDRIDRPTPN